MKFLWIGAGGAVGSVVRYLFELGLARWAPGGIPAATLAVNTLGSFAIGLVCVLLEARGALDSTLRLALVTGLLGGFTTYSTFNHQTLELLRTRGWLAAGGNLIATLVCCLVAGVLGLGMGRGLVRP